MKSVKKFKFIILIIVLYVMIFCACTDENQDKGDVDTLDTTTTTTYYINDNINYFRISGRCPVTDSGIACDWGGSGFSFNVNCEGAISLDYTKDSEQDIFFTIYIDGVRQDQRLKLTGTEGNCVLTDNLAKGLHTIELYKQTQNQKGLLCEFTNVIFKGTFESSPQAKSTRIVFLGDSITAGIGNLGKNGIDGGEPVNSDTTQTYAFMTGRALDADFSIIAQGGASLTPNTGTGVHLASVYKYINFERNRVDKWSFDSPVDVVVVNLGTNDRGVGSNDFIDGVVAMAGTLREYHKDSRIVFCMGMMSKGERNIEFKRAVSQLGGNEAGYYFVLLPANNEGSGAHPCVAGNEEASVVLTEYLRNILN